MQYSAKKAGTGYDVPAASGALKSTKDSDFKVTPWQSGFQRGGHAKELRVAPNRGV
jgi:hypothetical protein